MKIVIKAFDKFKGKIVGFVPYNLGTYLKRIDVVFVKRKNAITKCRKRESDRRELKIFILRKGFTFHITLCTI